MKTTRKQLLECDALTRQSLAVLSFENGVRYSTYSGISLFTALQEMSFQAQAGRQVILMSDEHESICLAQEIKQGRARISYEFCLSYAQTLTGISSTRELAKMKLLAPATPAPVADSYDEFTAYMDERAVQDELYAELLELDEFYGHDGPRQSTREHECFERIRAVVGKNGVSQAAFELQAAKFPGMILDYHLFV